MSKVYEAHLDSKEVKKEYSEMLCKIAENFLIEIRKECQDETGTLNLNLVSLFLDKHAVSGNMWILKKVIKLLEIKFNKTENEDKADLELNFLNLIELRIIKIKLLVLKQRRAKALQRAYLNKSE